MSNKKQLTFGALLSYAAIAFNIISGLLYTPWMISTIGDDQYALYTLALSVINIFLLDFGIGSAVTKFLSNYYARKQFEQANLFMGIVYKVFIIISAVIALCLTVFYFFIDAVYIKLTPDEITVFKRLFIIVAVYSVFSFPFTTFNGILMANERFIELKACNLGQKVLSVALIILFLLLGKGVYALVLVHAVSNVFFLIIKYICIRRKTKLRTKFSLWDKKTAISLFGYSAWITVMNIAQRCIFNIMPTIIAALIGSAEVTVFSLASTLESYVYLFADAVNGMFMPKISRILAKDDVDKKLTDLMSKVGRFHVCTLGLIFIGFICVGKDFVSAWMGDNYSLVYICTILLILPSVIYVPQQVAKTALLVNNIVKEQAFIYIAMAAMNMVLSFVLLPTIGVVGAAVSVCASYLMRTVAINILYHKKLPINLWSYFKYAYGRWLIVAAVTLVCGIVASKYIPLSGWLAVVVKGGVITFIYAGLLLIFCIEKQTVKKVIYKIRHRGGK